MKRHHSAFFLNLFNLVPFGFLDGGRIARILSRRAWIVGAIILGLLFLAAPSPQLALIAILGGVHVFRRADDADLEKVTDGDRKAWTGRYFGLAAFLGLAVFFTHELTNSQLR